MDLGLANAAAVVFGGSRGMGLATARCLAQDGARVAVIGRTQDALDGTVGPGAAGSFEDLTSPATSGCNPSRTAFLAARRHSYMTGANINVDGGSDFI
jgi:glycine/D-amino acid oxidase-like deaminating enzyme